METSTASISQLAAGVGDMVRQALDRYTQFSEDCPPRLCEAIRYSLLAPGKRLRPLLVLMSAEACGGDMEAALPAACAVEMIHTYSLVHDDLPCMDDDDLRRGRPTCHKQFGEALAVLAGDALLTMAFETLAGHLRPARVAADCCLELARAAGPMALVAGQADDLDGETAAPDLARLESIHRRKTGALILASVRLGGIIARASRRQRSALEEYGKRLGLAFQITDDLLDVAGDENTLGKRAGKDADRGKLTFPGLLGVDESRRRAEQLVTEAVAALRRIGPQAEGLEALARAVLERNH
ncbi:MAG: polyprenyl synthetase family protein [Planctomycetia bacterium]|nr:polyprenyl synthetase family protein [Planctomycetia bacterium]